MLVRFRHIFSLLKINEENIAMIMKMVNLFFLTPVWMPQSPSSRHPRHLQLSSMGRPLPISRQISSLRLSSWKDREGLKQNIFLIWPHKYLYDICFRNLIWSQLSISNISIWILRALNGLKLSRKAEKKIVTKLDHQTVDHGRSDWLGCWAEFVQMTRFRL